MAEKPNPNPEEKGNVGDEETPQTPEVPEQGTEGGEEPPKQTQPEGEGSPPEAVDYKEKFSESTRENQRILGESKLKSERIRELESKLESEPPSDKELAEKHPDWEYKDDEEKASIRREEAREKRLRQLEEKAAWDEDYSKVLKKYPDLAKYGEEFKEEAYKHPKSVDLETIAKSFLFGKTPEPAPEPEYPKPGLEKPTGGTGQAPSIGMTLGDITRLRETDERRYIKLVREGKIKEIPEK